MGIDNRDPWGNTTASGNSTVYRLEQPESRGDRSRKLQTNKRDATTAAADISKVDQVDASEQARPRCENRQESARENYEALKCELDPTIGRAA